jgi:hypothetical protein
VANFVKTTNLCLTKATNTEDSRSAYLNKELADNPSSCNALLDLVRNGGAADSRAQNLLRDLIRHCDDTIAQVIVESIAPIGIPGLSVKKQEVMYSEHIERTFSPGAELADRMNEMPFMRLYDRVTVTFEEMKYHWFPTDRPPTDWLDCGVR